MAKREDIYERLRAVLSAAGPDSWANSAIDDLKAEHSYHKDYKMGLNGMGYPIQRHGMNLTSQPGMYLPETVRKEHVSINKDLPYYVGGQSSPLYGIQLNPYNRQFDKAATLVHEVSHQRDFGKGSGGVRRDQPQGVLEQIRNRMLEHKENNKNYRTNRILSGQPEEDEIRAQLRAYEALLPAGMTMFQSPLGKDLFRDNADKLWYLNQTQPSMSDQKYLDEISSK